MRPNRDIIVGTGIVVVLIGSIVWLLLVHVAPQNVASTQKASTASTTAALPILSASSTQSVSGVTVNVSRKTRAAAYLPITELAKSILPVDHRDSISSWDIQTTVGTTTREKLTANIHTLLTKKSKYTAYDIYMQVAQDYEFLGNGKRAYDFYIRAAHADPSSGVPFSNLGGIMARIGAYNTAYTAYGKSIYLQPRVEQFWLAYLRFLTTYEAHAPATASIFASAKKATNSAPDVLIAEASWRTQTGNIKGAIADWELVLPHVGTAQEKAINAKIAGLEKQL